jgi:hypothetical protein
MRDTIDMAREAGMVFLAHVEEMRSPFSDGVWLEDMKAFEALVRADERSVEREALLDMVDAYAKNNTDLKAAIRARGNT